MSHNKQSYQKSFEDYSSLVCRLQQRGMQGDTAEILKRLQDVGYKRLNSYWIPFRDNSTGRLNCSIDTLWSIYRFDRKIRFLILDAIERIEVGIRSRLVHLFTGKYGPFGYLDNANYTNAKLGQDWLDAHCLSAKRLNSKNDEIVSQFHAKYMDKDYPLWISCEIMSFGAMLRFFNLIDRNIRLKVANQCGLSSWKVLASWLKALNDLRNACAHHNRVWNRGWVNTPTIPNNDRKWFFTFNQQTLKWEDQKQNLHSFTFNKTGILLTVCNYLLNSLASSSQWRNSVIALLGDSSFDVVDINWLGLHEQWELHPLWV